MRNDEYIEKIEQLNLENIKLKNSREYKIGQNILKTKDMLKRFQIIKLLKKIIDNKKMQKYNVHEELENNYEIKNKVSEDLKPKIAVYTCITGNYDKVILEPFVKSENIDFYLYTDNLEIKSLNWNIKEIPEELRQYDNILKNRYIKMHPKELFPKYDYAIYIDGNVEVMSDLTQLVYSVNDKTGISMHRHQFRNCIYNEIEVCRIKKKGNYNKMKEQVEKYRKDGFPEKFGMLEATIIVSDLINNNAHEILDEWWKEFISTESLRDQISLHYIIWKKRLTIDDFGNLGNNEYRNPKFRIYIH